MGRPDLRRGRARNRFRSSAQLRPSLTADTRLLPISARTLLGLTPRALAAWSTDIRFICVNYTATGIDLSMGSTDVPQGSGDPVVLDFLPTPSPLLFGCLATAYQRPENAENRPCLSREAPSKKRAGGGRGIRTHEGLHPSGFQ